MACAGGDRVAKTVHHVHGQAATVDGDEVERYVMRLTRGSDFISCGLAEILSIRPVTNDCCESVSRETGDIGRLNLRCDGTGFTKTVDGHWVRPRPEEA